MRVLHVISGLTTGGAESVLYRLVTNSSEAEHEVVCLEGRAWYSERLEKHGIKVHHVDWTSIGFLPAVLQLHRLIRSIDADLVQTWMYRPNLFAGISSRLAGRPVVWNIRCSTFDSYPMTTRAIARAGGFFARWVPDFVINCSAASRELHARIGYDSAAGAVVSNGYDATVFKPDEQARQATRRGLNLDSSCFVVATVGRWHAQKGLPELLAAMRLLKDRNIPGRLLMIGRGLGDDNPELRRIIDSSGCGESVELLGERADIPDLARVPDVHVLASVAGEGFPNVIAETMLSGTPNVVTDVGDAALIVDKTGWVVPPGDPGPLADAIEQAYREWSGSRERWEERRTAARRRIADNFALDRMVQDYERIWRQVVPMNLS